MIEATGDRMMSIKFLFSSVVDVLKSTLFPARRTIDDVLVTVLYGKYSRNVVHALLDDKMFCRELYRLARAYEEEWEWNKCSLSPESQKELNYRLTSAVKRFARRKLYNVRGLK